MTCAHRTAITVISLTVLATFIGPTLAVDRTWINPGSGFWSGVGNWSPSGLPVTGDNLSLTTSPGQTVFYDIQGDFLSTYGDVLVRAMALQLNETFLTSSLTIGTFGANNSTLTLAFGKYASIGTFDVGQNSIVNLASGTANLGTVIQSGGEFTASTRTRIDSLYRLTSGVLRGGLTNNGTFRNENGTLIGQGVSNQDIINNGTFVAGRTSADVSTMGVQNNGRLFVNPNAFARFDSIVNTGSMTFGAGSSTVVDEEIAQTGTGQTLQVGPIITSLALSGTWHQQAGTLLVHSGIRTNNHFDIRNGTFLLSGGTITLNEVDDLGTIPMRIGQFGDGTFVQSAGSVETRGQLIVGAQGGRGYFELSGGTCRPREIIVGNRSSISGTLLQTGGTLATTGSSDTLIINENGASTGLVDLAGGTSSFLSVVNHGLLRVRGNHVSSILYIDGLGDVTVSDSALLRADRMRQNSLAIGAGAAVAQPPQFVGAYTHRLRGLSIAQSGDTVLGSWDLDTDDLIVDYTGSSVAATIRQYLRSGNATGAWTGMGLKSTAAANNAMNNTGLGYAEASDIFGANGGVFSGVVVDGSAVLVKYTYYGDTDLNGIVNFDDYARIDAGFNNSNGNSWFRGDFDYNGVVNFDDYSLIDLGFNTQGPPLTSPLTSAVPEASSLAAGIIATLVMCRRTRCT